MCKPNACCQSSKLPRLGFYGLDFPVSPMTFIEIGHFGSFLERIGKSTRSWGLATEVIPRHLSHICHRSSTVLHVVKDLRQREALPRSKAEQLWSFALNCCGSLPYKVMLSFWGSWCQCTYRNTILVLDGGCCNLACSKFLMYSSLTVQSLVLRKASAG